MDREVVYPPDEVRDAVRTVVAGASEVLRSSASEVRGHTDLVRRSFCSWAKLPAVGEGGVDGRRAKIA